jgi:DNA-binding CsgD family transcriptional regulator
MSRGRKTDGARELVGVEREIERVAGLVQEGTSVVVAGPRGSGRTAFLRALAARFTSAAVLRTSAVLSSVPFGAIDAAEHPALNALRDDPDRRAEPFVVIVDDVEAVDDDSADLLARAVAAARITAVFGLRTARARSTEEPSALSAGRRAALDLWVEGHAARVDLPPFSDADAARFLAQFADVDLLDRVMREGLIWRADGSRSLLRHLVLEATNAARAGRDPLRAVQTVSRDSRLAVALSRHIADYPPADLRTLAVVGRLPRLETATATRLLDGESVEALVAGGQVHADVSPLRRLIANDVLAQEAERVLGSAAVDEAVDAAGVRMLAEADVWWSAAVSVSIAERWHRLGTSASGEVDQPAPVRRRIALDAARDANDRGDTAHAAAHAARGLTAGEDPRLRLEADIAAGVDLTPWLGDGLVDATDVVARRRSARNRVDAGVGCPTDEGTAAEARVATLLKESAAAGAAMQWDRALERAELAAAENEVPAPLHLRALLVAGAAAANRGRWSGARRSFAAVERMLDARPCPASISARQRLEAVTLLLASHQVAGADGSRLQRRLEREVATIAREGGSHDMPLAAVAMALGLTAAGRAHESQRELDQLIPATTVLPEPYPVMIVIAVADELAMAGRPLDARALLDRLDEQTTARARRGVLYARTTILVAEGRLEQARATARATAALSAGGGGAAFRIRDLYRLAVLGVAVEDEIDELVQLAATTDLPLAVEAVRRVSQRAAAGEDVKLSELRLHTLYSAEGTSVASPRPVVQYLPTVGSEPSPAEELTPREREIALLANDGLTNREIATRLFLSVRTVESHVYQARMKWGAATRAELGRLVAASGSAA